MAYGQSMWAGGEPEPLQREVSGHLGRAVFYPITILGGGSEAVTSYSVKLRFFINFLMKQSVLIMEIVLRAV